MRKEMCSIDVERVVRLAAPASAPHELGDVKILARLMKPTSSQPSTAAPCLHTTSSSSQVCRSTGTQSSVLTAPGIGDHCGPEVRTSLYGTQQI